MGLNKSKNEIQLKKFINKVSNNCIRKNWKNVGELKTAVVNALSDEPKLMPRYGWISYKELGIILDHDIDTK